MSKPINISSNSLHLYKDIKDVHFSYRNQNKSTLKKVYWRNYLNPKTHTCYISNI